MYLLAIIVTCNSCDQLNYFCICYYAGDHVQGACYAVPLSWKCYAFITVPSIQVSLKRLGQRCAHCLLFHSRHCCSLVSPFFLGTAFADMLRVYGPYLWGPLLWPESSMQGGGPRVADLGAWCMGLGPMIIIYIRIIGYCQISFLFLEELYIDEL